MWLSPSRGVPPSVQAITSYEKLTSHVEARATGTWSEYKEPQTPSKNGEREKLRTELE